MTVLRGFFIVTLSGLVSALGGGLIGYTLAMVAPGYYRGTNFNGRQPWFDPVEVGVGLGVTQGLICGVVVGCVVVLAVALSSFRRNNFDVARTAGRAWEVGRQTEEITGQPPRGS